MSHECEITELMQEGNDERVVRLVYELLDLDPQQTQERVERLLALGKSYLCLSLCRLRGEKAELVEAWLEAGEGSEQGRHGIKRGEAQDELSITWCREAVDVLTAAAEQAVRPADHAHALVYRALATYLLGESDEALSDLDQAQRLSPEGMQAFIAAWQQAISAGKSA
jgi:tetratricopeptide (TPR) repeat protein